jgi:SAM-dependent MidA family methyltransferase
MQQVLYAPGLGYYSAGNQKFGAGGDFITAPELSPLFAYALAAQCREIFQQFAFTKAPQILELGPGTGQLAFDLLQALAEHNALPEHYLLLEISGELRARQQQKLSQLPKALQSRIHWLETLPQDFNGIILANEVMDALPVHRFWVNAQQQLSESYVQLSPTGFTEHFLPAQAPLVAAFNRLQANLATPLVGPYLSEINLMLSPWLTSLSQCLDNGVVLLMDYGFSQAEYYHPQRQQGTLMCHYRHHAHSDPLLYPGLQDITAHIDFSHVAETALAKGLHLIGFTNQASFLMGNQLAELAQVAWEKAQNPYAIAQAVQVLTAPHEMGELFKVMALSTQPQLMLQGFAEHNQLHRL